MMGFCSSSCRCWLGSQKGVSALLDKEHGLPLHGGVGTSLIQLSPLSMLFSALIPETRSGRLFYLPMELANDREFTALLTAVVSPIYPHLEYLYQSAMLICRA